jgi:hypothetical protein
MHYLAETPTGDVGAGCWHSEIHAPAEFIERGERGDLGPTVQAVIAKAWRGRDSDLDDVLALLEPASRWPGP